MPSQDPKTYAIVLAGEVEFEGSGEAYGMIMASSMTMAIKHVITHLGVGLNMQLTEVPIDDRNARLFQAVGRHDHNFTVKIEEIQVIIAEPPKKGKKR